MSIEDAKESYGRERELRDNNYNPITAAELKAPEPAALTTEEATAELVTRRAAEAPQSTVIEYKDTNLNKRDAFDLDGATAVLENARNVDRTRAEAAQDVEDAKLADAIDKIRGVQTETDRKAEQWQEQHAQQTEQEQAQRQADQARQHQEANEAARMAQQISAAAQHMEAQRISFASGMVNDYPELAGLSREQIPGAIAAMKQRNPQRGAALEQRIATLQQLNAQARAVQARKSQHDQATHSGYLSTQSRAFFDSVKADAPERRQAVMGNMENVLRESGIDPNAYISLCKQGSEIGRYLASKEAMSLIYRASAAMLNDKARSNHVAELRAKVVPPDVPPVQRPGTTAPNAARSQSTVRLQRSYSGDSKGLADAAAALISRRNSR